jgi:type IV fimbrial biogenesis protein FimT
MPDLKSSRLAGGFTLVELMVAVAILALLLALAAPGFNLWLANAKVRTANDSLQNGLRLAQAEAQRRFRQVVFYRSDSAVCANATVAQVTGTGKYWIVKTIALDANDLVDVIQCGAMSDAPANLAAAGPAAICFSASGRMAAVTNPNVGGAECTVPLNGVQELDVTSTLSGTRRLRVRVNLAGSVRSCDVDKTQSSSTPDGCPA